MSASAEEHHHHQQQQRRPSSGLGTLMTMFRQKQQSPSSSQQREEDDDHHQQEEESEQVSTDLWGKVHIVRTKLPPSDDGNSHNNISNSASIPSLGSYIINATKKSSDGNSIINGQGGGGGDTVTSEITMNILELDPDAMEEESEGESSSSEDDDGLYGQFAEYVTNNNTDVVQNNASNNECDDDYSHDGDLTDDGFLNSNTVGDQKRALQQLVRYVQKDNSQHHQQQQQGGGGGLDVSRRSMASTGSLGNISFGVSSVAAHKKRMKNVSSHHQYHDENEMGEYNDEYYMKNDGGGSSIDEIDDSERQYFDEMKKRVLIPPPSSATAAATADIPLKSDNIDSAIIGKYKPATKGSISTAKSRQQQESSSTTINALDQLNQLANNRVENRRGSLNSRYSIASTGTFGDISFGVSSVAAHKKRMMNGNNNNSGDVRNSLGQSDARRYSMASTGSLGNISFGVSSVFAHKKRLNGGVKNGYNCEERKKSAVACNDRGASGGGGGTDDSSGDDDSYDFFMKQRMDVTPSKPKPSPPSNTSSTTPLLSPQDRKPSDYQLQKQKQQQRREQRPKDNEYTDTEIDAIIELKLEIANQRTVIDNLSSKLNRALADNKALEEKVEEQNKMLPLDANSCDANSSIISSIISNSNEDNLIRQLGNSIRSSFMLGQQQKQTAATPLKGEATTSPSSSSSWGKEKASSSPPASNNNNTSSSSFTKSNNNNDLMLQKQIHELQSMLEYIQHSLQSQKEDAFQKERMYQLQLNELKNVNRELREKNLRLTRDMDQQRRQKGGVDESDREEKASLPSNYPSAPSSFTSRDDGENDDDEGGIEEKEEKEPDSVEAAVADLSQLMVQDVKEKEEGMGEGDNTSLQGGEDCSSTNGGPIAISSYDR
jgi:hypothetical protein